MRLFTYQAAGHDITKSHKPLPDYTEETGVYYQFAQYLKWPSWVWAFPSLDDYYAELCLDYMEIPHSWRLWRLDVPEEQIKWVFFSRQMENCFRMEEYFAPDQATIRQANDLPLAIVKTPIQKKWVRG